MPGSQGYISLAEAAKLSGYSAEHIRRLCVAGKLRGAKVGKTWVITIDEVRKLDPAVKSGSEPVAEPVVPIPSSLGTQTDQHLSQIVSKLDLIADKLGGQMPQPRPSAFTPVKRFLALSMREIILILALMGVLSAPIFSNLFGLQDQISHLKTQFAQVIVQSPPTMKTDYSYIQSLIKTTVKDMLSKLPSNNLTLAPGSSAASDGAQATPDSTTPAPSANHDGYVLGISTDQQLVASIKSVLSDPEVQQEFRGPPGPTSQYIPNSGSVFGVTAPTAAPQNQGTIGSASNLSSENLSSNKVTVTEQTDLQGHTSITGPTSVTGNLSIVGNITLSGDLLAGTDNTYHLGSSTIRWSSLHTGPTGILVHNDITDISKVSLIFSGSTAVLGTDAATPLQLTTGANTGINILANGNVGVGTTNPSSLFDVVGNSTFAGNVTQTGASTFSTGTGAVSLNGATSVTGTNTFDTGTGNVSLNGATTITGTNTFSTGTGQVTFNNVTTNFTATNPVIDTTDGASTLSINTTTNRPITTGTGLTTLGGNLTVTGTAWTATPTISGLVTATSGLTANGPITVQNNSNFSQTGTGTFSTGTGNISLNGAATITGANTFSTGTGNVTFNNTTTIISATNPVIDATNGASTLNINTTTNRPVMFGTGLVTIPNLTVTNSQSNNGTMVIDSAATTATIFEVIGNSLTSGTAIQKAVTANAGNGQTTHGEILNLVDATTAGGGFTGIGITVTGAGTGSGSKYLLDLNPGANKEVVFDTNGAFRPTTSSATNTNTIGSPSFYWKNGYFDTITANSLSGTVVTGATSSTTWTIGSTQAGDVNEAVVFQRNSGSGNAVLQWNSGAGDLRYLGVNYPLNNTYTVSDTSIGTGVNLYSGLLTNNTTAGTQKLLSLTNTGTGTTEDGIYINNTGTGTTAFEIAGTWTNGLVTNNNSINAGTGAISGGAITGTTFNGNTFTPGSSTYTGTAGQTYTFPTTSATIARTDAGQTFTGTQVFSSLITGSISGNAATVTTNANLTGPITSVGNATSVASQTGTGSTFVMQASPTLTTPNIGAATGSSLNLGAGAITSGLINGQTISSAANFTGTLNTAGDITAAASQYVRARYTNTNNTYSGTLGWYNLQLGNNGTNYIVGGRTSVGGNLTFVVNNTTDAPTIDGTTALTLASTGAATFGSTVNVNGGIEYVAGSEAIRGTDTYLRLNNASGFTSGVYTPGAFRASGTITGDGTISAGTFTGSVSGSSYGSLTATGATGGYAGIYLSSAAGTVAGMYDTAGNGGNWDPTTGWHFYWNRANASLGLGGSTTSASYKVYANGALNATGGLYDAGNRPCSASAFGACDSRYTRNDTTGQYLKPYYEYSTNYLTTEAPSTLASQMGGGGLRVDFMHPSYTANGQWGQAITWSGYNYYGAYQLVGGYSRDNSPSLAFREENGSNAWSNWRTVLDSGNYTGYAPTLTGGGASGTWGINITGNAVTVTQHPGRTDAAWYQINWNNGASGDNNEYSSGNILLRSSGYGAIGWNGSAWYIEGNASYGLYSNTGLDAAGGLWDAGNRVCSATTCSVGNISASTVTGTSLAISGGSYFTGGNVGENMKLVGGASSDVGISGYNSSGTWVWQLYGAGANYGFLNGNWAGWDMMKTVGGTMVLNGSETVITSASIGSQSVSYASTSGNANACSNDGNCDFPNGAYVNSSGNIYGVGWLISGGDVRARNGYLYLGASDYEAVRGNDSYLRLNQSGQFSSGIYSPYDMRIDGHAYFGGATSTTCGNVCEMAVMGPSGFYAGFFYRPTDVGSAEIATFRSNYYGTDTWSASIIADGSYSQASDRRLKDNIQYMSDADGLDIINQLKPATFNFIGQTELKSGFIAQEVQTVIPNLVNQTQDGWFSLNYAGFAPYLTKAIQGLDAKTAGNYLGTDLTPGDLVKFSTTPGTVEKAVASDNAIGVVASASSAIRVQYVGQTKVKVSEENGAIHAGDKLTLSAQLPGYAAKMTISGQSIGTALEDSAESGSMNHESGLGTISVMVSIGYQHIDVQQNSQGQLVSTAATEDLDMNGFIIKNIKSLVSQSGKWSIDEQGNLSVQGHITAGKDTTGSIIIPAGTTSAQVSFTNPYAATPKIVVTPQSDTGTYWVGEKTITGFTIHTSQPVTADTEFDWVALAGDPTANVASEPAVIGGLLAPGTADASTTNTTTAPATTDTSTSSTTTTTTTTTPTTTTDTTTTAPTTTDTTTSSTTTTPTTTTTTTTPTTSTTTDTTTSSTTTTTPTTTDTTTSSTTTTPTTTAPTTTDTTTSPTTTTPTTTP